MKHTIKADCGNAPKKLFLRDLNIAFAEGNDQFLLDHAAEDMIWQVFGDNEWKGKEAVALALRDMQGAKTEEIIIYNIITHGKEGAVNGEILLADGNRFAYCDVYTFRSAGMSKISSIRSYVVPI